ncbi:MAG: multiprotein bridging factor aMBF1 [Halobacteriota archaeon]
MEIKSKAQCEICGTEIKGEVYRIRIDASELSVCKSCARLGTLVVEAKKGKEVLEPQHTNSNANAQPKRKPISELYTQIDHEIEAEMEIDAVEEDYGRKIKEAREKAGLKQAELAQRINEKHSLLRKIENEELMPGEEIRKKIERALKDFFA